LSLLPSHHGFKELEKQTVNPFAFLLVNKIECKKCPQQVLNRYDIAYDLSLDIHSNNVSLPTLEQCFSKFFVPEAVADYKCVKCSIRDACSNIKNEFEMLGPDKKVEKEALKKEFEFLRTLFEKKI